MAARAPKNVVSVALADVVLAHNRLAPYLVPTPIEEAPGLGQRVWLKLENVNRTHSFKIRGALNAMLTLDDAARARGVIAASSGNHAQGIACAAHMLGVRARIVMAEGVAKRKIAGVGRWGGEVILHGETYTDAEAEALRLRAAEGLTYISPYNDRQVVSGQGTIGLEIVEALPDVERVIVPVGGGGLISGIALAIKALRPSVEVIGVSPVDAPTMYNAFYDAALPDPEVSIADALPGAIERGSITLALTQQYVDRIVLVEESAIREAMRWLLAEQGWLVEGGGAVGVAALEWGLIADDGVPTCVVISGGNIDAEVVRGVL
jgi:threonine dehydratase